MSVKLSQVVLDQLPGAAEKLANAKVLVGLDGFVDTIIHVVAKRASATEYTRMGAMGDFGQRISAAAGLSANFEFVTQMIKLGGNGPIMANALGSYGTSVTYVGNLGSPNIHSVFTDFAARSARVISIAEPGYTDAIEFEDGKLMCGKHDSLRQVTWETLLEHISEAEIVDLFQQSSLIALVNWTMLPFMSDIWKKIQARIAPKLTGEKRWIFFDLADPAKRTPEDIIEALDIIAGFQRHFRVILGLNLQEARQVGTVLGLTAPDDSPEQVTRHAACLLEKLKVDTVVVHPTAFAAAADSTGATHVAGPFTAKPKITTGAGDHFNAGFCIGRLLGLDIAGSLQVGVATSGFYVRQAKSPALEDLKGFLEAL
ncbi:MAG: PfkB family carbohydrate kinase [Chthoniobacteraceae bacterium]